MNVDSIDEVIGCIINQTEILLDIGEADSLQRSDRTKIDSVIDNLEQLSLSLQKLKNETKNNNVCSFIVRKIHAQPVERPMGNSRS